MLGMNRAARRVAGIWLGAVAVSFGLGLVSVSAAAQTYPINNPVVTRIGAWDARAVSVEYVKNYKTTDRIKVTAVLKNTSSLPLPVTRSSFFFALYSGYMSKPVLPAEFDAGPVVGFAQLIKPGQETRIVVSFEVFGDGQKQMRIFQMVARNGPDYATNYYNKGGMYSISGPN
ncbi:hypothetical protein FHS95_002556 [Sphingomonas naasensis]|uniref:Uncharacterized protein n=1 Tax=Sphingomonas naasensis TaxID=1344951 RepID=A0A4S1WJF7_9SPHN|nr:hypothetical protein [Sphingomonas naasensis]NIJ20864.1 hypothetical protein [Sphingomonas naasensis]TGX43259.1 hypothetical protein E5A74_08820 [Sphingomonas naasensis]